MELVDRFPLSEKLVYLDTAVMGCVPSSTLEAVRVYVEGLLEHMEGGRPWGFNVEEGVGVRERAEELFAKVVGAKPNEVLGIPNASLGINTVMGMVPVERGENVVSTDLVFPMGAAVLARRGEKGAETRFLRSHGGVVEVEAFEKAVDDQTSIVYLDQPSWFNGYMFDLEAVAEICHDHGALLVVDFTQSAGAVEWDVKGVGVDFAAASTYKWLLGGRPSMCAGFLYAREEHLEEYQPDLVSWGSYEIDKREGAGPLADISFKPTHGVRRLSVARVPDVAFVAVENSMKVLLKQGLDRIEAWNRRLVSRLVDLLAEAGYELQTPLEEDRRTYLNVKVEGLSEVVKTLNQEGYWCSERVGGIRVSPNFYNTLDHVERFYERLASLAPPS